MKGLISISLFICKVYKAYIFTFFQIKPLKIYEKCFLFHLSCCFGSCNIQILGWNLEIENQKPMTSRYGLHNLPTLIFRKIQKPLQIKGLKIVRWWTIKEKNPRNILGNILKVVPGTF